MIYIENDSLNPFYNHALEEFFLKHSEESFCILWRNRPSVLIGRNQNALDECRLDVIKKQQIDIVRRLSGGGAVYTDPENVNFTMIMSKNEQNKPDSGQFAFFAAPVIEALQALGVPAECSGRNDIIVNGRKISGNAQYIYKDRILHHGTLLFSGDLTTLASVLTPAAEKYKDTYIQSVRSRVTAISEHMDTQGMTVMEFREYMKQYLIDYYKIKKCYTPDSAEQKKIQQIMEQRFTTDQWTFGKVPGRGIKKRRKFPSGLVEVYLSVKFGKISEIHFYGDFFGNKPASVLAKQLEGTPYTLECLLAALQKADSEQFISGVSSENICELLLDIKQAEQGTGVNE